MFLIFNVHDDFSLSEIRILPFEMRDAGYGMFEGILKMEVFKLWH